MAYVTLHKNVLTTPEYALADAETQDLVEFYVEENVDLWVDSDVLEFPKDTLVGVELMNEDTEEIYNFRVRVTHLVPPEMLKASLATKAQTIASTDTFRVSPQTDAQRPYIPSGIDFSKCAAPNETIKPAKEANRMTKLNSLSDAFSSMKDSFFVQVHNVVLDIQSGAMGIQVEDGLTTYDGETIKVNPIGAFGMPVPAFAVRTPLSNIAAGDILIQDKEAMFVTSKVGKDNQVKVLKTNGANGSITPVVNILFGTPGVLVVKNMLSGFGGGGGGGSGLSSMLPLLLMGGKDMGDMLPLLLMSGGLGGAQGAAGAPAMNPMMLMLLMGNKGGSGDNDMFKTMMMLQCFGGAGAGMFGCAPQAPADFEKSV